MAINQLGLVDCGKDPLRQLAGLLRARGVRAQDGKFVTTETSDNARLRRARPQPVGDRKQQGVSNAMPQRVIDILEAVEIQAQNGDAFMSSRGDQRMRGQFVKLGPIGEPCERVVVGHERDLRFVAFALSDISAGAAIALESAPCKGWIAVGLQPDLRFVRLADRKLESAKGLPAGKALQVADPMLAGERVDPERFRELEADMVSRQLEIGITGCDCQPVVGFPDDV